MAQVYRFADGKHTAEPARSLLDFRTALVALEGADEIPSMHLSGAEGKLVPLWVEVRIGERVRWQVAGEVEGTVMGIKVLLRPILDLGVTAMLLTGLGGCGASLTQSAPHPDRPEIASSRLEADRVRSGCPIRLRFTIRDAEANVTRALASWSYEGSTAVGGRPIRVVQDGFAAVPLDPSSLAGRRQGEAEIVLTPLQPGHYVYSVQVEDAAGHRSNVLEQSFTVLAQPAGKPVSCSDPVG